MQPSVYSHGTGSRQRVSAILNNVRRNLRLVQTAA
jgi:hypothetical protein